MDVVIDTNIVISGLYYSDSDQHQILRMVVDGEITAFCSEEIKNEYVAKIKFLTNPEIQEKKFKKGSFDLTLYSDFIKNLNIVNVSSKVDICRDPKDNMFLACALDANCEYITSGDKDLLDLKEYKGIRIVKATEFLAEIENLKGLEL